MLQEFYDPIKDEPIFLKEEFGNWYWGKNELFPVSESERSISKTGANFYMKSDKGTFLCHLNMDEKRFSINETVGDSHHIVWGKENHTLFKKNGTAEVINSNATSIVTSRKYKISDEFVEEEDLEKHGIYLKKPENLKSKSKIKNRNFLQVGMAALALVASVGLAVYSTPGMKQNIDRAAFNKTGHALIQSDHDFMKHEMEKFMSSKGGLDSIDFIVYEKMEAHEKAGAFDDVSKFKKAVAKENEPFLANVVGDEVEIKTFEQAKSSIGDIRAKLAGNSVKNKLKM